MRAKQGRTILMMLLVIGGTASARQSNNESARNELESIHQVQKGEERETNPSRTQEKPNKASDRPAGSSMRITFLKLSRTKEWTGSSLSRGGDFRFVQTTAGPGKLFLVVRYKVSFTDKSELPTFTQAVLIDSRGSKTTTDYTVTETLGDREMVIEQPFLIKPGLIPKAIQIGEISFETKAPSRKTKG